MARNNYAEHTTLAEHSKTTNQMFDDVDGAITKAVKRGVSKCEVLSMLSFMQFKVSLDTYREIAEENDEPEESDELTEEDIDQAFKEVMSEISDLIDGLQAELDKAGRDE